MTRPLLLDSDVLVDFLRGYGPAVAFVKARADRIVLSSIVAAELQAGVKETAEQTVLDDLLAIFRVAPVTAAIARVAGILKRDFGKSHGVGLADAILAATAQAEGAELATLNVKHYPMIKGLRPPYEKR